MKRIHSERNTRVPPKAPPPPPGRVVHETFWPRVIAGRPVGYQQPEKPRDASDFMDMVVAVACIVIAAGFAIASLVKAWPW